MLSLCQSESQYDNLLYSNHKLITHISEISCPTHPRAVQMAQGIRGNLQKLTSTGAYSGNSYLMWKSIAYNAVVGMERDCHDIKSVALLIQH